VNFGVMILIGAVIGNVGGHGVQLPQYQGNGFGSVDAIVDVVGLQQETVNLYSGPNTLHYLT